MSSYRLTSKARDDLVGIKRYTLRTWGAAQCRRYLAELRDRFRAIARREGREQACDHIRPGLKRQKQGHHYIFYLRGAQGVRIARVLHERMIHEAHEFPPEDET